MDIYDLKNIGWRFEDRKEHYSRFSGFKRISTRNGLGYEMVRNHETEWTIIYEVSIIGKHITRFRGFVKDIEDLRLLHKMILV
jgi:hypothetical protein